MNRRTLCIAIFIFTLILPCQYSMSQKAPILIDAHAHFLTAEEGSGHKPPDYESIVLSTLRIMDSHGIRTSVIMPHPFTAGQRGIYSEKAFIAAISRHPKRFVWLGGGGTLNVMLHSHAKNLSVSDAAKKEFTDEARAIIKNGARGFGEIAPEHFSLRSGHPYESTPPDHPLLLALADIAAENNVPIEIHMECIPLDMPFPEQIDRNANPKTLKGNLDAFKRLLAHNRSAKIVWSHLGWDNTGARNTALTADLLANNGNLYMNVKFGRDSQFNRLLDPSQKIPPEWITLIDRFPDRIMFATDQFYTPSGTAQPERISPALKFMSMLPERYRRRVGYENAAKLFNITD